MRNVSIKRLLAFVLAAAMIFSLVPQHVHAAPNENLALGRPATASNVESGTSFTADKAVDGSTSTRWATDVNVSNPWLEIDLDDGSVIKQIIIAFERTDANQNILGFRLEAEADGAWQTIYTHANGRAKQREKITLEQPVTADKLKLTVTEYDGGQNPTWFSVSVCEVEVYAAEVMSLADVADSLNAMTGTVVDGETLTLPAAPEGITVEMNGADLEQIIGKDLSVYKPLTDKTVNVSFKLSDGAASLVTGDIPVTVKGAYEQAEGMNAKPQVIPEIQEWYSESTEKLAIDGVTKVTYDDDALNTVVDEFVADYEAFTGIKLDPIQGEAQANAFNFSLTAPDAYLGDEGYTMQIQSDRINVAARTTTGNMYGMQTILQMTRLDDEGFAIGQMRDYPRFQARGLLLDMARKPIAMTMVGNIARTMRYYKMNDLQLHLNDNYIWLEQYGTYADEDNGFNAYEAFRLESSLTNAAGEDPTAEDYYVTKDEMRTFIQSQRALGMNIVPEIDVPAHAMAFTKVWPELSIDNEVRNGHTLIDHFNLSDPAAVAKIKEIFDDYTKDTDTIPATFDAETTVHIGADEYYLSGTLYRQFVNEMIPYMKQTNSNVRLWGSLTQMNDNNQTQIIPEAIHGVQMNIWNTGWANPQDMYDLGFDLINTIDGTSYMVPNGGYGRGGYGDLLNLNSLFSSFAVNKMGNTNLPSGDEQILGAAFAIWNDNIDRAASGLTESDVFFRFFDALPIFAEKTWAATGQEKGSAAALTELSKELGVAPGTNPYFEVASSGDVHASYDFETLADVSGNGRNLTAGTAAVENGVLTLSGGSSYISTPIDKAGNRTGLSFDITLTEAAQPGQILFETTPEYYTHDIRIMADGTLGFTRELYDYSFGYTLPVGETVHIEIIAEQQQTSLYVNGELFGAAIGKFVHNGVEKKTNIGNSTFALPLERIGSESNAIAATIDNVCVKQIADPADDSRDIPVEVLTATAGDWQQGYESTGEGPAEFVLDGDPNTLWHTDWYGTSRENHWIQFELSGDYVVDGLRYLPRTGGSNGVITEYEIQASDDGVTFMPVAHGNWANNKSWKVVNFEGIQAKYVRLVSLDSISDKPANMFASAAEIRLTGVAGGEQPHKHSYEAVVTAPTCTEGGYTTYTCACGDTYVADETAALGHTEGEAVRENEKAATCTEAGSYESVVYCSVCEVELSRETVEVAMLGHDYQVYEVVPPTCTKSGYTVYKCSRCDKTYKDDPVEPEHKFDEGTVIEPTCTEMGCTVYTCLVCGLEYEMEGTYTPALGHDFVNGDCTRCDAVLESNFMDVPVGQFYFDPVAWAVEKGITTGATTTTFDPNGSCLRGHVVTFLWRAMGSPEPRTTVNPFVDVPEYEYYYKAVLWAYENGITTGIDATHFAPTGKCNRAQAVTFLWRAMGKPDSEAEVTFTDVKSGEFYTTAVAWAVEKGITDGMGDGTFGVEKTCNRAQAVTFLYRARVE